MDRCEDGALEVEEGRVGGGLEDSLDEGERRWPAAANVRSMPC